MFMSTEQCLGSGHLCSFSHKEISSSGWCGIEHVHSLLLPTSKGEICHPLGFWTVFKAFEQFCLTLGLLLLSSEKECKRFNFTGSLSDFWQVNFVLWERFLLLNSKLLCMGDENFEFADFVLQYKDISLIFSHSMPSKYKYPNI